MKMNKEVPKTNQQEPLRLWPGVLFAILILILRYGIPLVVSGTVIYGIFGSLIGSLAILVWWAFFSRVQKFDRWSAIILMIIVVIITPHFLHASIATGAQGSMFYLFAIPILAVAFVLWAVITRKFSIAIRRASMVATIILACAAWTLLRIDGITGEFNLDLALRWAKTSEERLLDQDLNEPDKLISNAALPHVAEWPGFRGPNRDGIISNVEVETDWSSSPPKELWRRSIGPGCSSFAISGDYIFTQEQLGEAELVSCYYLKTGDQIWTHADETRFWDSHAGAGPRSTPTFSNGRIYTLGATGILNALNARDGSVIWSRKVVNDTNAEHSGWGYTSSPLVIDDMVIIAMVGQLIAYDLDSGNPRWFGPDGGDSYSSPHLLSIDGIDQIVLLSASGATSLSPVGGTLLWEYSWPGDSRILQPAMMEEGKLLISDGEAKSLRCIKINHEFEKWIIEELWTTTQLKPNFNDFVIHKGYAYGYNGPLLVCIDLKDGQRKWRSGRYGGQIMLLASQDLLVVLTEKGELALVRANPNQFEELALLEAIEGKTWNHPAMAGNILLIRNSQEMVAYRMK